ASYQISPLTTSSLPSLLMSATAAPSETKCLSTTIFFHFKGDADFAGGSAASRARPSAGASVAASPKSFGRMKGSSRNSGGHLCAGDYPLTEIEVQGLLSAFGGVQNLFESLGQHGRQALQPCRINQSDADEIAQMRPVLVAIG